jgi:hypothetical protein
MGHRPGVRPVSARNAPKNRAALLVVGDALIVAHRAYRSKWWTIACGCPPSRRRKDGSCRHQRALLAQSPIAHRTRIDPVQMGSRTKAAA